MLEVDSQIFAKYKFIIEIYKYKTIETFVKDFVHKSMKNSRSLA